MELWAAWGAVAVVAYLLGSIPTGYLIGKFLRDIDIREHGSKSTGATNVFRTLGKWPALFVLLVDLAKGAAAVVLARWIYSWLPMQPMTPVSGPLTAQDFQAWAVLIAGFAALVGHGRSIWLNFTGGKSAATGLGVLLAMSPVVGLAVAFIWAAVLAVFRIVSLSSILAAFTGMVLVLSLEQPLPYRLLVIAGGIFVIVRHTANIQRLLKGTEPRLGHNGS